MAAILRLVTGGKKKDRQYHRTQVEENPPDGDDEEAPVDHTQSGKFDDAPKEKIFMERPGIPMPPVPRFRLYLCIRWMVLTAIVLGLLHVLGRWMTEQAVYEIETVSEIVLDVDNCDVEMLSLPESLPKSVVTVQYWKFMNQIHGVDRKDLSDGGEKLTVSLDMRVKIPMFRCLVTIFAPKGHLDRLSGHVGGSEHCRMIMSEALAQEVNLTSQQVSVQVAALPKKFTLSSTHGMVAFHPSEVKEDWEVDLQASSVNVFAQIPSDMSVKLHGHAKENSVLCGDAVSTTGAGYEMTYKGASAGVKGKFSLNVLKEAAGYVQAGLDSSASGLEVVRGSSQEKPELFNHSAVQLEELSEWMKLRAQGAAPWVARVHVNGPQLPRGSWEVLSSEAFLTVPLQWYVLLSAGTLRPIVKEVHIHPMGLGAWPQEELEEAHNRTKRRLVPVLDKEFQLLLPYFQKADAPDATVAWVPHHGRPLVMTKATNGWAASVLSLTQVNVLMFLIAVAFNIVVAFTVSAAFLMWLQNNAEAQQEIMDEAVTTASSHRVGKIGSGKINTSWRVIATHVEQPDQGVILRWRKRTGVQQSVFLCVKAKADPDPSRGLEGDEICIDMANQELVDMKSESNIIVEFFFSASGSKGYPANAGYEPTGKDLKCQYNYRFQIEGYNHNQEHVATSDWSNEVYIKPRSTVFDVPLRILKSNFAVPTNSLEYFVEHFAEFNIHGKHPQQLVILSKIKVCYHKNWNDFRDCKSDFRLTAYMGESSVKCEKDMRSGTVRNFDTTGLFQPLDVGMDIDDDEEARTQELDDAIIGPNQSLELGAADRRLTDVFITLRKSSGEDVAEGKLDWWDLVEAFEQDEDQQIFVELVTDKVEGEFDEEWLVWVEAEVTFRNELDPECEQMPFKDRFFQSDPPGEIYYEGMERFVAWDPTSEAFADIKDFDIYMSYPDDDLDPVLLVEKAQVSNGGASIMITFPAGISANYVVCQMGVEAFNQDGEVTYARSTLDEQMPMRSHRFIICRTWNLAEFELMYASFCRMNNMEMERVTEDALAGYGMVVAREQLKVVHGLRQSLVFEEALEEDRVLDCPGLIMISEKNIIAKHPSTLTGEAMVVGSDAGGSILRTVSSGKSPLLGGSSSGGGRTGARAGPIVIKPREYRATFQTVGFLENAWPRYPSVFDIGYGTGWMPSFLLLNSFYPVDNIINAFAQGAETLQLQVAYQTVQVLGGKRVADNFLGFLQAPLYGLVPYCCEGFLYLLQMASFLLLPFLLLVFGLCYELVGMFFATNPEEYNVVLRSKSHIPDMTFSGVVSGHTLEDWLNGLTSVSYVALLGSAGTAALMLLLICESNFLRNLPPFDFQHSVHRLINALGNIIVTTYLWAILSFVISSVLWFAMVVVIYPEQMLTALACAGGLAAVFATMISGLKTTKDELERSLREEIPEVLELACATFLDQYDKTSSGRSKAVSAQFRKLEESLAENSNRYVRTRLSQNKDVQEIIDVRNKKPPKEVLGSLFNRALVKEKNWAAITASENGDGSAVETTETVLESLGLPQEDTSVMPYLDLRMRLEDKEREEGGENIHTYGSDLQEKLMKVYVRMQERHMDVAPDVDDALRNPKRLAICMSRANGAKFKALERISEGKDARSSLQICIQDLNQQQVDKVYVRMVEHLDESLSQVDIQEKVTPFVETTIPAEIEKQVRFVLDEQRPKSAAQRLFDTIRRKKNSIKRAEVRQRLTLRKAYEPEGLMAFLEDVGLIDKSAGRKKAMHYISFYNRVERGVHSWRREDDDGLESKDLVLDPADVEDFVRELVHGHIWWGAMEEVLKNIGFPMASELLKRETNLLSREQVMYQFEIAAAKDGMLAKDKFLDFLRKVSCADVADGAAGRIWKAQMVMMLQHLNICGFVGKSLDKAEKDADVADDGLREMSRQRWPNWLEKAWEGVAPKLSEGSDARPFLPRTLIYTFVKSVAFSREEKSRTMSEEWKAMKVVDEEYDTWKLQKDEGDSKRYYVWVNRGKSVQRLRGIWHEVFLDILAKMGSPVQDVKQGLLLFDDALREQGRATDEFDGLLSVDFMVNHWMQKKLVENTDEVSLQIFKDALEKAEFTLPTSSVEALWYAADKTKCTHPSLRQVRDLEDRLVMYMSSGMFFESVRTLITNELQVPTLHGLEAKEIKAAFKQVDEKTGCCGIIDPHEVCELLLLLSQEGMDLQTVQASFQQLHMNLDPDAIQDAFMIVDTNCDDKIDLTEFLSLIDKLVDQVIPESIFEYMGLLRHQILSNVVMKVTTILTMFLFVFVSLNAFHVNVGQKATTAGSSMIRAALAGLALLGLRNDNSPEYMEKQYNIAREQLYRITGVSRSQLEARRRGAAGGGLGLGIGMSFAKGRARRGGGGGGSMFNKDEEEEDVDGGDM